MDAFSDVFKSIRLEGAVYISAEFSEPWCVWSEFGLPLVQDRIAGYEHVFFFHFIEEGGCQLRLSGENEVVRAVAGDFILFSRAERHLIGSDLDVLAVESASLEDAEFTEHGILEIRHGGGGRATRFVCGYIACSRNTNRFLFDALPRVMRIPVGDGQAAELLATLLRTAVQVSRSPGAGGEAILAKLSELIFVEALRGYVARLPPGATGWLAAVRDRQVGRVLALLHDNPMRAWTIGELARDVALSESALTQRFTSLVKVSPIRYLKRWRLALAAQELRDSGNAIIRVAMDSGYASEAAFNRAFRKEFGMPPAAWRKAATLEARRA